MTKQEAAKRAKLYFGYPIFGQGSEDGTGYANRCYLMRRIVKKTISYESVGIGRTWDDALQDALRTCRQEGCL